MSNNTPAHHPVKRHEILQPFSRQHHYGLLLCWKIREGFRKNIEHERIKAHIDWFWKNHLQPHFEIEEKYVFPILGKDHEMVRKALSEHRRLKRLFEQSKDVEITLSLIEEELEQHIRFEERVLFNEVQEHASEKELKSIQQLLLPQENDNGWDDQFWK